MNSSILRAGPVVCAVDREYQIMVPVNCETLMSVSVNGKDYYCHSNGVRKSRCAVQKFTVPMAELDMSGGYTLRYRRVISRQAYACLKGPLNVKTFAFRPLSNNRPVNVYVLSDTHGIRQAAIKSASFFRDDLDLLILNGDISSSCMTEEEAMLPYDIAYGVTGGSVPCVITRGNHDLRGRFSEELHEWLPSLNGRTYYPIDLGALLLLVLDCGEDKNDDHREYGGTAVFHAMRMEETEFLRRFARSFDNHQPQQICHKLVVSHIPVPFRDHGISKGERPFDIENDIYSEWVDILNADVRPDLYIAGHLHRSELWRVDSPKNERRINCPVLITGVPVRGRQPDCIGAALTVSKKEILIRFTDMNHTVIHTETICLGE